MANYNPKSLKAEEFINDGEIRETLAWAEANKRNVELIDEILNKARPQKTETGYVCAGLSHREASVLLACDIPEKIREHIFIPGFTTKGDGHGMGLHIVQRTLNERGGEITVDSTDERTVFSGHVPKLAAKVDTTNERGE